MSKFYRASLAAAAAVLMSTAGAFAADLYGGSIKDSGGYQPMNAGRPALFYMRGDFTAASNNLGTVTEVPNYTFNDARIGNSHSWGGGVGMHFTPNIRGDLTLDFGSTATINGSVNNSIGNAQGQFGVKHTVGLANLYYDFDAGGRFTPYLGVGLGFSRNTTTAGQGTATCSTCAGVANATYTTDGSTKTNAAAAFMAGVSAKLADRWTIDAGYRFLYTGDARTSDVAVVYPVAGTTATIPALNVSDLYSHELRVGLRMDLR